MADKAQKMAEAFALFVNNHYKDGSVSRLAADLRRIDQEESNPKGRPADTYVCPICERPASVTFGCECQKKKVQLDPQYPEAHALILEHEQPQPAMATEHQGFLLNLEHSEVLRALNHPDGFCGISVTRLIKDWLLMWDWIESHTTNRPPCTCDVEAAVREEREACAKMVDDMCRARETFQSDRHHNNACATIAAAIRARGNE